MFNLLLVLGITALMTPEGVSVPTSAPLVDIPVMLATAVACLPIFLNGHTIYRWEGGLFLGYDSCDTCSLRLDSSHHALHHPVALFRTQRVRIGF